LALAGIELVRDRSIENAVVGKSLPLSKKETAAFYERWKDHLQALGAAYPTDLMRDRFLNLVDYAMAALSA
jgi:hypothetical protein